MAFATPFSARRRAPRARAWFVRLAPAALLLAGALLLAKPWRGVELQASGGSGAAAGPAYSSAAIEPSAVVGALLVVGGLLFFLPGLLERFAPSLRRGAGRIEVVEQRPLGGRRALLLVEIDGRRLLIGASEQGLATLAELDGHAPAPARARTFERALEAELAPPIVPAVAGSAA
jgi:flagellar biogenesis protein FliO